MRHFENMRSATYFQDPRYILQALFHIVPLL